MFNKIIRDPQALNPNSGESLLFEKFQDGTAKSALKGILLHSDHPLTISSQGT